jgi:hypothetical protein
VATPNSTQRNLVVALVVTILLAFGSLFATLAAGWSPKLGLDLAGGLLGCLQDGEARQSGRPAGDPDGAAESRERPRRLGATVNLQGKNIVVSVPGVTNARDVLAAVGQTAQLLFRPVICFATADSKTPDPGSPTISQCSPQYYQSAANLNVVPNPSSLNGYTSNNIPPDPKYVHVASTALRPGHSHQGRSVAAVEQPYEVATCWTGRADRSGDCFGLRAAGPDQCLGR